jgi:hypothetical protein
MEEDGQPSTLQHNRKSGQRRTEPAPPGSIVNPSLGLTTTQSEGELGSWKYEDETDDGDDGSDEDGDDVNAVTGVGPLGLIRQFQKAQGEVRNAGVGPSGI